MLANIIQVIWPITQVKPFKLFRMKNLENIEKLLLQEMEDIKGGVVGTNAETLMAKGYVIWILRNPVIKKWYPDPRCPQARPVDIVL